MCIRDRRCGLHVLYNGSGLNALNNNWRSFQNRWLDTTWVMRILREVRRVRGFGVVFARIRSSNFSVSNIMLSLKQFSILAITVLSQELPDSSLCLHIRLPLPFMWRWQHHPSSGIRKCFYWRPFVTHLSLILFQHNRTPFGEIKGLRFHKIPLKSPKAHLRTSRSPQKEHNHHTSVTTGIPDTANSQPESDGSPSPTTSPSKEGST